MFLFGPIGPTELVIIIVLIIPYFIPTIIAVIRKHQSTPAIVLINVLLGWTLIGWIAALVWSLSALSTTTNVNIYNAPPSSAESRFCSKCGIPISSSDSFCSKCGTKLK